MKNADVIFGNEVQIWGRNAVIGTTLEELYAYDQALDWNAILAAAAGLDLASSAAADDGNPAGTGANVLSIFGLDGSFMPQIEDITLEGQTQINSAKTFRRVFGAEVKTVGSGGVNAGDIHIVKDGTGGTWTLGVPGTLTSALCKVLAGWGASLNGMFTTPAGMKYKVKSLWLSTRAQAVTVGLYSRVVGANPLLAMTPIEISTGNSLVLDFEKLGWKVWFDEKTDVLLRVFAAAASGIASGGMKLVRIP